MTATSRPFRILNLVRDTSGWSRRSGYRSVAAVVGHDFGSPVAAWCALLRPDVFRSVVLMSAPFAGPPELPFDTARRARSPAAATSTRILPPWLAAQALSLVLLDARGRRRHAPLSAEAFTLSCAPTTTTRAPTGQAISHSRCVMDRGGARQAADLLRHGPRQEHGRDRRRRMPQQPRRLPRTAGSRSTSCAVYSTEFERTGFQGGLQWYRCRDQPRVRGRAGSCSAGRTIDVPSCFIAGSSDWGPSRCRARWRRCRQARALDMRGCHLGRGRRTLGPAGAARSCHRPVSKVP